VSELTSPIRKKKWDILNFNGVCAMSLAAISLHGSYGWFCAKETVGKVTPRE
jgi:hypothetical protein